MTVDPSLGGPVGEPIGPNPPSVPALIGDGDRALLAGQSRQSPVAVFFIAWRFIKNLGFVQIAVALAFIFSGRLPLGLLTAGVFAALIGLGVMMLSWWRFVFSVAGDELLVTRGIIGVERLTIPLDRVQSVSIDQKFLHRPIGLVSVKVDTAGSSEAELEIDAVERSKAEALQRLAAGRRAAAGSELGSHAGAAGTGSGVADAVATPVDVELEEVIKRTPAELVRIGLTKWPWAGLVALAPLGAVFNGLADVDSTGFSPPFGDRFEDGRLVDSVADLGLPLFAVAAGVILVAGLLGVILQVGQSLLSDWELTLTRTTTGFRRTAGLLNTTSRASTLTRIQAVRTDQSPAQRWFGIRGMILPTIGEGDLTVPGTTDEELARVREIVFGDDREPQLDRMISPLFVFLQTRNAAIMSLAPTIGLYFALGPWSLLILTLPFLAWSAARRQWRLRRWGISHDRLAESLRFIITRDADLELIKAQTVSVNQSFFERRRGLATVNVDLAEGHLAVPLIPLADAEAVRDRVLHAVQSDRRPWM